MWKVDPAYTTEKVKPAFIIIYVAISSWQESIEDLVKSEKCAAYYVTSKSGRPSPSSRQLQSAGWSVCLLVRIKRKEEKMKEDSGQCYVKNAFVLVMDKLFRYKNNENNEKAGKKQKT